jgi:hypothetical protein
MALVVLAQPPFWFVSVTIGIIFTPAKTDVQNNCLI